MKGHGDDGLDSGPEVFFLAKGADEEVRQQPGEDGEPPVFIEKYDILGDTLVPGPGTVPRKWGPLLQAIEAKMGLTSALEKASAAETARGIRPSQSLQAIPADDFFAGPLQESLTDLAGRGKKEELPELSPKGKPAGQERGQPFSASFFC